MLAQLGLRAHLALLAPQDQPELLVMPGQPVQQEQLLRWQVQPDPLDRLDLLDLLDLKALMDQLARKAFKVSRAFKVWLAQPVQLVHRETPVLLDQLVHLEPLAALGRRDPLVRRETQDQPARRDLPVLQVRQDLLAQPAPPALLAPRARKELRVMLDQLDHRASKVSRVCRATLDRPDRLARAALLARLVRLAQNPLLQAPQAQPDRSEALDLQDRPVRRAMLDRQAQLDLLVEPGLPDLLVLKAMLVPLVPRAYRAFKARKVTQAPLVPREVLDLLAPQGLPVAPDLPGLQGRIPRLLDPPDQRALKEVLARPDRRVSRAFKVSKVIPDLLAQPERQALLDQLDRLELIRLWQVLLGRLEPEQQARLAQREAPEQLAPPDLHQLIGR